MFFSLGFRRNWRTSTTSITRAMEELLHQWRAEKTYTNEEKRETWRRRRRPGERVDIDSGTFKVSSQSDAWQCSVGWTLSKCF
ncbi:hypothetical protein MHYP_G00050650 [Metynnis hypsauchen]